MAQAERPPHPYLTREEVNGRMEILNLSPTNIGHTQARMTALKELIAGAIAEWADLSSEIFDGETDWNRLEAELQEWAEEYLVR